MLRQLDYATRAHHVVADSARAALLRTPTREAYVAYLLRTYAFEAPIEARWQHTTRLATAIDITRRLRTHYLVSDLRALGCTVEPVVPASFVGIEQALGWMYVVERGRRMNGLLQRHLVRRRMTELTTASTYLATSSPLGMRWQELGITLDRVAHNYAIAEQIINAAQRAFRTLRATLAPPTTGARAA